MESKTKKYSSILFVLFALLYVGMALPTFGQTANTAAQEQINWLSFEEAVAANEKNPKKIYIDFYTDWCGWCKKMDRSTFIDPAIVQYMNENYYAIKFDAEQKEDIVFKGETFSFVNNGRRGHHKLAYEILQGKMSYPTSVFLNEKQEIIAPAPGYLAAEDLIVTLNYVAEEKYLAGVPFATYHEEFKAKQAGATTPAKKTGATTPTKATKGTTAKQPVNQGKVGAATANKPTKTVKMGKAPAPNTNKTTKTTKTTQKPQVKSTNKAVNKGAAKAAANNKDGINWISFNEAVELCEAEPKKVIIDLYTDWCGWCKKMDAATFSDPEVIKYINENYYAVKFNAEQKETITIGDQEYKFVANGRRGYHELAAYLTGGNLSYPTVVFLNEQLQGKKDMIMPGFKDKANMMRILKDVKAR